MENNNNSEEKKNNKMSSKAYKDLGGLSEKHLNFGLWLLENKKKFKHALVIFLIVFSASTLSYSAWHYTNYMLYGRHQHKEMMDQYNVSLIDSQALREVMSPHNLLFSFTEAYFVNGKYDFITKINNPNPRHYAKFNYCFEAFNTELACGESFILPNEEKYVISLGHEISENISNPNFVIKDISWQRITAHVIEDWDRFINERFRFETEIYEFNKTENNFFNLRFSVTNNSTYGYYSLPLQIILYQNDREVAVNYYLVNDFKGAEKVNINLSWPAAFINANRVEIIPDLDVLDTENYLPFRGN